MVTYTSTGFKISEKDSFNTQALADAYPEIRKLMHTKYGIPYRDFKYGLTYQQGDLLTPDDMFSLGITKPLMEIESFSFSYTLAGDGQLMNISSDTAISHSVGFAPSSLIDDDREIVVNQSAPYSVKINGKEKGSGFFESTSFEVISPEGHPGTQYLLFYKGEWTFVLQLKGAEKDLTKNKNIVEIVQQMWGAEDGELAVPFDDVNYTLPFVPGIDRTAKDNVRGSNQDDFIFAGDGADQIRGRGGDDELYGNRDRDKIFGGSGDDFLNGGGQGDYLYGGDGQDTLVGGSGRDHLTGGDGQDLFVFARKQGKDVVKDFQAGVDGDILDFSRLSKILDFEDLLANHAGQKGEDVRISGNSSTITLRDVTLDELTAENFLF